MADPEKALATQIANIETKTGKSVAQVRAAIAKQGLTKHGDARAWIMATYGLGHGDANTLTHVALNPKDAGAGKSSGDVLAEIYSGKKEHLRPVHDRLMEAIESFGSFEIAPKKGYVSLRRKKQFAMLGPKTNDRFELGLNLKENVADKRAKAQAPGGMCNYIVALADAAEVDGALIAIVRRAYDNAG